MDSPGGMKGRDPEGNAPGARKTSEAMVRFAPSAGNFGARPTPRGNCAPVSALWVPLLLKTFKSEHFFSPPKAANSTSNSSFILPESHIERRQLIINWSVTRSRHSLTSLGRFYYGFHSIPAGAFRDSAPPHFPQTGATRTKLQQEIFHVPKKPLPNCN